MSRWRHTLCLVGADRLGGEVLDRLCDACESTRTGLVLAYRSIPAQVRRGWDGGTRPSPSCGSATPRTPGWQPSRSGPSTGLCSASSPTPWAPRSPAPPAGPTPARWRPPIRCRSRRPPARARAGAGAAVTPGQAPRRSARAPGRAAGTESASSGTSDSESVTEGINASTSWGWSTSTAIGANESLAKTAQRSREFLVEPHQLQQLPPSAVIISYASRQGRQVVLADANPAILALPTASSAEPGRGRVGTGGRADGTGAGRAGAGSGPAAGRGGAVGGRRWAAPAGGERVGAPGRQARPARPRQASPSRRPTGPARPPWPTRAGQLAVEEGQAAAEPRVPPEPLDWRQDRGE